MTSMYRELLSERCLARCAHKQIASSRQHKRDLEYYRKLIYVVNNIRNMLHQLMMLIGPSNIGRCPMSPLHFPTLHDSN